MVVLLLSKRHAFILSLHLNNEEIIVFSIPGLNCPAIDRVLIDLKHEKGHALLDVIHWLKPWVLCLDFTTEHAR